MKKTIVTERLALAAICSEDREKLIRLLCDSEVGKTYMVPNLRTEDQKNRLFDHLYAISKSEQRFLYGIYHQNCLIGLIHDVKLCEDEIELGYVISPEEQNRGYATEAVKAVIRELFYLGYAVIKAGAFSENAASIRVMEKCGMERTGETGTIAYRGEDHNCICYAIRYSSEVK